jgi:hypothetical protein
MNTDTQAAARELLNTVQDDVLATFPSEAEYYRGFFKRFAPQLLQTVIAALDPLMTEAAERLDAAQNNRWHTLNAVSLSTQLAKADADTVQWLLSRVPAHRPDLASVTNQWARNAGISVPDHSEIERAVPAVLSGRMWLLRLSDTGVIGGVIPQAEFGRFAALAWEDEESGSGALLDAAVGWFGAAKAIERAKAQDGPLPEWKLQQQFDFLKASSAGLADEEQLRKEARYAVQVRRWLLDAAGLPIPEPKQVVVVSAEPKDAPTPVEIEELLGQIPDEIKASERESANIAAVHKLLEPPSRAAWPILLKYSGWGGLSIEKAKNRLPEAWVPSEEALVHEFYTPTLLCQEVARLVRPWVDGLPLHNSTVLALEPSAGIGRFVNALSVPGFELLKWTAIEYSRPSAAILQRFRPDINLVSSSFEEWVASFGGRLRGKVGLVVGNPPYGQRGPEVTVDPDKRFRDDKAYVYFLRRNLDLLAEGGVLAMIVPYGLMTGRAPYFTNLRRELLGSHHLRLAYRLPSSIFPGAKIVTDLVVFESRGGSLSATLVEDNYIVAGEYFERHPSNILGDEVTDTDEKKAFRYEVTGTFVRLPDAESRPRCLVCSVTRHDLPPSQVVAKRLADESLPLHVQAAVTLGVRVGSYLDLLASGRQSDIGKASARWLELTQSLQSWVRAGNHPIRATEAWSEHTEIATFRAAFAPDGGLSESLANRPLFIPSYVGSGDLIEQAIWLYRQARSLMISDIERLRIERGDSVRPQTEIASELVKAGWFCEWADEESLNKWLPEQDYLTGLLWPRYDNALLRSKTDDSVAASQLQRLQERLTTKRIVEIDPEPRSRTIPAEVVRDWGSFWLKFELPILERIGGFITVENIPYQFVKTGSSSEALKILLGYLNHDLSLFQPDYIKRVDEEGVEETSGEALARVRISYHTQARESFRSWISTDATAMNKVEIAYNRAAGGYVVPEYSTEPLDIERWGKRITLKPHQNSAARRLIAGVRGLLALDVGVGKTYTGIATIAYLRQIGSCRRPIVIVPNGLAWKWFKDFATATPDYRVLVIGSTRSLGKDGFFAAKTDSSAERIAKWRKFQAGEYDVAIVTYSMFARLRVTRATWERFALSSEVLSGNLSLQSRELLEVAQRAEKRGEAERPLGTVSDSAAEKEVGVRWAGLSEDARQKVKEEIATRRRDEHVAQESAIADVLVGKKTLSERAEAIERMALDRWVAEQDQQDPKSVDEGLTFENVNPDLIMVDEAQNFKNLWPVRPIEGGMPKYLGAIADGAARAYELAVRAFHVRSQRAGGGVMFLSATPAKNSPLEYFSLVGMVDATAWERVGIATPEDFIDRYLRLESRDIINPDMSVKTVQVVAGFRNLDELRNAIFRVSEFKTAEEVGLKLPPRDVKQVMVELSPDQDKVYRMYAAAYKNALKKAAQLTEGAALVARRKALGYLVRMALCSVHAELPTGPATPFEVIEGMSLSDPRMPPAERLRRMALLTKCGRVPVDKSDAAVDAAYRSAVDGRIATQEQIEEWRDETAVLGLDALEQLAATLEKTGNKVSDGWTWAGAGRVTNPHSPKIDKVVQEIMLQKDCGHLIFCDNVAVHRWLVMCLTEAGFDPKRIAVINADQAKDTARRLSIAERFNGIPAIVAADGTLEQEAVPPDYDVVIANATAYEGIDLHIRTCEVYHLDLPWEPATLQQRNGRAVRQGNTQAVIGIKYIMSARSLDVIRFNMIVGKLGWMTDLLSSADRETNNPAAQSEMSADEMVMYMSRDPESAKRAVEVLRAAQAEAAADRIKTRAWNELRGLISRVSVVSRMAANEERAVVEREILTMKAALRKIPEKVWPWYWLVEQPDKAIVLGFDWALQANSFLNPFGEGVEDPTSPLAGGETGQVVNTTIGLRRFGESRWVPFDPAKDEPPEMLQIVTDDRLRDPAAYPLNEDTRLFEAGLREALSKAEETGTWERLGIRWASDRFREYLYRNHWDAVLWTVKGRGLDFLVPVRVDDGPISLLQGKDTRVTATSLVSFDRKEYAIFYRQITSAPTDLKYTDINLTCESWWGIKFPRGVLTPRTVTYTEDGNSRTARVEFARGSFAAVPSTRVSPSGVLLVHIPSETAFAQLSGGIEVAKALIDSLQSRRDWGHPDLLPRLMELKAELDWWAVQSNPPTRESLAAAVF